jgi:hypothetical protein
MSRLVRALVVVSLAALTAGGGAALSASADRPTDAGAVAAHWTAERRAQATPRDLVLDQRGLAYLRGRNRELRSYGHATPAKTPEIHASGGATNGGKPNPGAAPSGDTTAPSITSRDPAAGATIGASYVFKATVTDAGGVRSVSFEITYPDASKRSYKASLGSDNVWSISFSGFTNGSWGWKVVAKDKAGNTATSPSTAFTVNTGGGGGGGGGGSTVTNAQWTGGGTVQTALGRIYFEMPSNSRQTRWTAYVCSGTAVTDTRTDASVILTAAHCVYDDVYKAFARNVLFIPNQSGTTGAGTDTNCSNDPIGCWAPTYGVVDQDWTTRTFPDNIAWDYAYYVVPTTGAHTGASAPSESLEAAAGTLGISFSTPSTGSTAVTHALGYSYSEDPKLMYCAEGMGTEGSVNWWLSQCGLSGGSSGGAWMQPVNGGNGPVISLNSWGYTNQPGMAGPKLSGTSASCVFEAAQNSSLTPTNRGVIPSGC